MTPEAFVAKWKAATTKERSAAQEHFIDLCRMLGEPTPNEADPTGNWYAFEKGASKAGGGDGWADVWRRARFGWEYKGKGKDLGAALKQLQLYAPALENPPLLIVSDIDTVEIHTAFTNAVRAVHRITLDDILDYDKRQVLKAAFADPERLRPGQTRAQLTEKAAGQFAEVAQRLRARGHEPHAVAHFLNRMLFCLFAEDVGLLPEDLFSRMVRAAKASPAAFQTHAASLFAAMRQGGFVGFTHVDHFNGGLFDTDDALPLEPAEIDTLNEVAELDWSSVEPAIFGTLFLRGLDPSKRAQLGAQYTDPDTIRRLVWPVIVEPLLAEWATIKADIAKALPKNRKKADALFKWFLDRLRWFRVLDPACGSGNFLYIALQALKDIEHQVNLEAEAMGLERQFPAVGPESVHGIEINAFAAELARVTVWIGEIQWMIRHGYNLSRSPILKPLDTIEERDALINPDGNEAEWPKADGIVGNPPFLGDKKMRGELGDEYVEKLRTLFKGRVPGGADLVTYWFEKARAQIENGLAPRVGLVATNSIRGGANRQVLDRVLKTAPIFNAWSDEPWINEGAAVRVSLIAFGSGSGAVLDALPVARIHADLTAATGDSPIDVTQARQLAENAGVSFIGTQKNGPFDIPRNLAVAWLASPNPHGIPNSAVLKPWINGIALTRRDPERWVIDFGANTPLSEAVLFELPFSHVEKYVKPTREGNRDPRAGPLWWLHKRSNEDLRSALSTVTRYAVTPRVAKYRVWVWRSATVLPDSAVALVARSDDTTFGILHSRFHELWSLRLCTWLGVGNDPRYTPTTTFETFPFPDGLTPNIDPEHYTNPHATAVAEAARKLNELRENWLNPPEWVDRVPEVVPGYPDRIIAKPGREADLKKRTLTNLYNQRPAWLDNAHKALDAAVAAAYGWDDYTSEMTDDEILRRLLALNLDRAGATATAA